MSTEEARGSDKEPEDMPIPDETEVEMEAGEEGTGELEATDGEPADGRRSCRTGPGKKDPPPMQRGTGSSYGAHHTLTKGLTTSSAGMRL